MIESIEAINKIHALKQSSQWEHLSPAVRQKQLNKLNHHYAVIGNECGRMHETLLKMFGMIADALKWFAKNIYDFAIALKELLESDS
ncbi:hypothetical protein G7062_11335 [Erysipelothrix sp. HDW6C]|uniref:hypothetical protein n=1 Tax=Erysipelothrix sp. HDW6C TaxID=2714930 RepID=UPI0014081290|nr:hypothetical protein [Erysipelothrix sp. HDW6C]QIK70851.1 hypothetical protein G7062_11335 [Erysipelothrix sp. HDW6C]